MKDGFPKFLRFNPAGDSTSYGKLLYPPTNGFTSLPADTVEHAPLEAVYIFFDTATYNEIERDVKVTKYTVPAFRYIHCNALEARQKQKCTHAGDN